jgi:hypothetical protein
MQPEIQREVNQNQSKRLQFFEGIFDGFEYIGEIQYKYVGKIINFFQNGSGIRKITKVLTVIFLLVWSLYINYMFCSDIYNKGILYAFDNQFFINRYFYPFLLLITYFFIAKQYILNNLQ